MVLRISFSFLVFTLQSLFEDLSMLLCVHLVHYLQLRHYVSDWNSVSAPSPSSFLLCALLLSKFPLDWPTGGTIKRSEGRKRSGICCLTPFLLVQFVTSCNLPWKPEPFVRAPVLVDSGCAVHWSLLLETGAFPFIPHWVPWTMPIPWLKTVLSHPFWRLHLLPAGTQLIQSSMV